jgi:O-antigen ligase
MHNDWLQVLFEGGIIFFTSMLILYFFMLKKSVNRPELFSMVIAYGLIAMTLYPLHLFVYQMVGTVLVYCCFREEISLA